MTRILVVGHTYIVGVNQSKLEALSRFDDVAVLVPSRWHDKTWKRTFVPEHHAPSCELYVVRAWLTGRGGRYLLDPWRVYRVLRRWAPDVIHVEQEVFALVSFEIALIAGLMRIPFTIFCWENVDRRFGLLRKATSQHVIRRAKGIVAGSPKGERLLRSWGYVGPTTVAPQLGINPSRSPRPVHRGTSVTIGYVGRLVPEKGVDTLLKAIATVKSGGGDARLVIVGEGPCRAQLIEEASRLGLEGIDWRLGVPHEDVDRQLQQLDLLVLPSRDTSTWQEQLGHILIEGMANGVPVLGSRCGAIPEVIGRDDVIFEQNDSEGLARLISRFLRDPDWRIELRDHGLNRVDRSFTHENVALRLSDFLRMHALEVGA